MRTNAFTTQAEEAFREFISRPEFPCLGAKAALNAETYFVRGYEELGGASVTAHLATDLSEFANAQCRANAEYATFAAIFARPRAANELQFEELLWIQLRALHQHDAERSEWDPAVSSDPADPHFSFSFAGQALYVIGMHPNSSRQARRFHWPTLVFNPHEQFERLRAGGKWKHMQETIRHRDLALQGAINPMLSDFGERSEARQYSGRAVEEDWQAPFRATPRKCPFAH
jgi:uncharacterized protein